MVLANACILQVRLTLVFAHEPQVPLVRQLVAAHADTGAAGSGVVVLAEHSKVRPTTQAVSCAGTAASVPEHCLVTGTSCQGKLKIVRACLLSS